MKTSFILNPLRLGPYRRIKMLRGTCIPLLKPYVNVHHHESDNVLDIHKLKAAIRGFKRENPNYNFHCCIIGCHGNSLLHLV